jgi:hypothetical protein
MGRRNIAMNTMNLLWAFNFTPKEGQSFNMDMESYVAVCDPLSSCGFFGFV